VSSQSHGSFTQLKKMIEVRALRNEARTRKKAIGTE
jgi:hypothetical protein